ncbi:Gfo/Idh/MocA family protein [Arvimicrobium flavum]|uniref:Gfo/Idh/MocA family protein n=1 Tax=Arvimicrobium flavum TaxID=3393320 RepID=UPI00237A9D96|nr:Gfo/Idh/MocA family oxidoreductase [Mesorhizobium shangrilense]
MTVKLGVVGTGWWATFSHIPTAQADGRADVVAIADLDADRVNSVGEKFGIARRYADVRDMLAKEKLDGVIISTPHVVHVQAALPALEAGVHCLIEKPMATTAADARAIVRAAQKAGREVMIPCGYNFTDHTRKAGEIVASGRIGEVRHVVCQFATALEDLFGGKPMLETVEHMYRPPASTWADPKRAGGYGWGQMSHSIAWVYRVADLSPESVFCFAGKSPTGVDYFDAASVRFTNGATMSLSGSALLPKHSRPQLDIRIFGTEGMLLFDAERERLELHRLDGKGEEKLQLAAGAGDYDGRAPINAFIDVCLGNTAANEANGENGARVVETLEVMYRSAASGVAERI